MAVEVVMGADVVAMVTMAGVCEEGGVTWGADVAVTVTREGVCVVGGATCMAADDITG